MSSTEVTDLINALRSGSMTLEQVAQRFRQHSWQRARHPEPQSYEQLAAANLRDPEPLTPGSIDEVTAAYDRGDLTAEQYDVLSEAVADAINAAEPKRS